MDYKKMFNDVIETLSEALEELQTQYENIKDELNEAVKGGELDEQIKSLQLDCNSISQDIASI